MARSNETKIVLLGKTGVGKSSLGNAILGDSLFEEKLSPTSVTNKCNAGSKYINGEHVTVIDTPGIFDNTLKEEDLKAEMIKCIKHCAPAIRAFLIVLRVVDRYTDQEKEIIHKIKQYFSEESLKHAVVVFTHGDQLLEGQTIDEFVKKSKDLTELVGMCGGKCHVVDSKYWKDQQDGNRSNNLEVEKLLKTIETMKHNKGVYTNKLLQLVGKEKGKWPVGQILKITAGITVGALLGMLAGATVLVTPFCFVTGAAIGAVAGGALGGTVAYNTRSIIEVIRILT
ncbi:GTPase IMAP family member 9-like [Fundulus heteroclitus]|uniref:GTPase IMAP family member 9-like n=1 Tax=Fundulus heteroclitus TaxID=8078 RepID=UPI00165BC77B|nr:GTPase IMAP family member 9-like [Fundulus heteroclitus]